MELDVVQVAADPAKSRRRRDSRLSRELGIEKKYVDTSLVLGALPASTDASAAEFDPATVSCLNAIAQGDYRDWETV